MREPCTCISAFAVGSTKDGLRLNSLKDMRDSAQGIRYWMSSSDVVWKASSKAWMVAG